MDCGICGFKGHMRPDWNQMLQRLCVTYTQTHIHIDRTWFVSACVTTSVSPRLCVQRVGEHVYACTKCPHEHAGMCLTIDKVVWCMRLFMWDILRQLCNELFVRMRTQSHILLTIGIKAGLLFSFFWPTYAHLDRKQLSDWYVNWPTTACFVFMGHLGAGLPEIHTHRHTKIPMLYHDQFVRILQGG